MRRIKNDNILFITDTFRALGFTISVLFTLLVLLPSLVLLSFVSWLMLEHYRICREALKRGVCVLKAMTHR